jgi:dynein heavy chain
MDFDLRSIEITKSYTKVEWREDLKSLMKTAGGEGKSTVRACVPWACVCVRSSPGVRPQVFLFSDTQVKESSFLEDINNILNSGEVPNMYPGDERQAILEMLRGPAKDTGRNLETPLQLWAFFVERCRNNLHIVLCMSPIGEAFRTRLRMFPSFVNSCNIDWFQKWPEEALLSVANQFLHPIEMQQKDKDACIRMCRTFHQTVEALSQTFLLRERRNNYVTPTSYLELIKLYIDLLAVKRTEVSLVKSRYTNGLGKLADTATEVKKMQVALEELKPTLVKASEETAALKVVIESKVPEVTRLKTIASKDEAEASAKAEEVRQIKEECERDLAEAIPALNSALEALNTIKKQARAHARAHTHDRTHACARARRTLTWSSR